METEKSHNPEAKQSLYDQLEEISKSLEQIGEKFSPLRSLCHYRIKLGETATTDSDSSVESHVEESNSAKNNPLYHLDCLLLESLSQLAEMGVDRMDEMFIALYELDEAIKDFKEIIKGVEKDQKP